jgi:hypothetical protein
MANTAQSPSMNDGTRRLIDAVARDLVATQAGSGRRDVGPDMAGTSTSAAPSTDGAAASDQDTQRFFGSILGGLVSTVIPKLATGILGMLQQRRRELGLPEERDAASMERDLQSILASLLPKLLEAVPVIAGALGGKPAPRSADEESQRFLPFLAAVLPAVISAVPHIISAFNRRRGTDDTPPALSDPNVAERFIGPLMQTLVPQLLQSAPSILSAIFGGGRREVSTAAW